MNSDNHEQLTGGVGSIGGDDDAPVVKINPIPEGEITLGQSGEPTAWDRDPLRDAVTSGALDGATIVKGEGGKNPHFPMDEQVPPENILGRVESWTYEDGVGPVGEAQLADDDIARRVDLGLLDVSADMVRHLGEYDDERGVNTVDSIDSMPRITVLENGAARNATIEPARAEALGALPQQIHNADDGETVEQLATVSIHKPSYSGTSADRDWYRPAMDDFETDDLSEVAGHFIASENGFPPENFGDLHLPVVFPDGTLSLSGLQVAKSRASQISGISSDDVTRARRTIDTLANDEFDKDWTTEQNAPNADADADADGGDVDEQSPAEGTEFPATSDSDMPEDDIKEQLSTAQNRVSTLEDEKETLEEQLAEKDDLEEQLSDKESTIEAKDEEIDDLEDEVELLRGPLAAVVAENNDALSEDIAKERFSGEELVEMLANMSGTDNDDDDQSATDKVKEQLSAGVATRGQGTDEPDPEGEVTEEQLAAANDLSVGIMSGSDVMQASEEGLSGREYIKQHKGVDPVEYDSETALKKEIERKNGGDN